MAALGSSCASSSGSPAASASSVDLANFAQVKQVALDQGFECTPQESLQGAALTSCHVPVADPAHRGDVPTTVVMIHAGNGFDGMAELNAVAAGCPTYVETSHPHGWIWAGDGYFIQLFLDGTDPTPAEQAIKAAFGEVLCTF